MSSNVRESQVILNNLLKAKGASKDLLRNLRSGERDANRVLAVVSQIGRGDVTGVIMQLSTLGPLGLKAALVLGAAAVAYGIYQQITAEKPSEYYYWRYPK
jgi:hypothetical protein